MRKPEERTPGGRGSSSLDPPFLVEGTLRVPSLFLPGLRPMNQRPWWPAPSWAGWGGGFSDGKGPSHPPKPSLGGRTVRGTVRSGPSEATINHRCPSAHTGADEGRSTHPTEREKEGGGATGPSSTRKGWVQNRSLISHSVTASLLEAFCRWYTPATKYFLYLPLLPQNANPNQGTYMGFGK